MRIASLALALLLAAGTATSAVAEPSHVSYRGECRKLSKQIVRYERDLGWAVERGNELWARANLRQIERLQNRRDRLCPHLAEDDLAERVAKLLKAAAKIAKTAFTLGLL